MCMHGSNALAGAGGPGGGGGDGAEPSMNANASQLQSWQHIAAQSSAVDLRCNVMQDSKEVRLMLINITPTQSMELNLAVQRCQQKRCRGVNGSEDKSGGDDQHRWETSSSSRECGGVGVLLRRN